MKYDTFLINQFSNRANCSDKLPVDCVQHIENIAQKSKSQKGVFTVLVTLLVYKCLHSAQDIRKHQKNMDGGFSGRSIDTKFITPILRQLHLPSMGESGWLTRSLEQPYPYDLKYKGKISGGVKKPFLQIINAIEEQKIDPKMVLKHLLFATDIFIATDKITITPLSNPENITIDLIMLFLEKHFIHNYHTAGGSKLPVIALHCVMQVLVKEFDRYNNCTLKQLGSHTASDRSSRCCGDIEIFQENILFETMEVKHDRPITPHIVRLAKEKIYKHNPQRYYVLSNSEIQAKNDCQKIITHVKKQHGCQIILNGILPTIKYYLRLITRLNDFMTKYLKAVENDTELKSEHKQRCNDLIKKLEI